MESKDYNEQIIVISRILPYLQKKERNWLLGNLSPNLSKSYEYKLKSSIKKKIQTFIDLELPLLIKNNFIIPYEPESLEKGLGNRSNHDNTSLGKAKVPGPNPGQGSPIFVKARYEDLIDLMILLPEDQQNSSLNFILHHDDTRLM